MSADVNEVCRLLDELKIEHNEIDGHEVRWRDEDGKQWAFFGRIYSGRGTRLCAYDIDPVKAVERATGRKVR